MTPPVFRTLTVVSMLPPSSTSITRSTPLPPVKNGYRPLPTDPGLGITIDEDKLMGMVGEPHSYSPQFDPDDGSVVDW